MFPAPYGYPANFFTISSSGYSSLRFEINPSEYDPYPERLYRIIPVASGTPLINTDVYDNRIYTMRFAEITSGFYNILRSFADTNVEGGLEQLTFTDGDIGAFQAEPIKILRVTGQPFTSFSGLYHNPTIINYQNVEVEFIADT